MKKTATKVTRTEPIKPEGLVIQDIVIRNVDRTPKDVSTWRSAHISAESVTYPNRTRLLDLYSDILLDGHLHGIIYNKRIATIRNKQIVYKDATGKKVDEMDTVINGKVFRDLKTRILETPAFGLSAVQFLPNKFEFEDIPRKHIKPEFGIISVEQSDYSNGYDYNKMDFVLVFGEKYDLGYLLICAFYALLKRGDFSDWAEFVEIFGQPIRVIKYDAHDTKTKVQLKQVLDESGSSLALMIPKQADFEIMDGKISNADGKLQDTLRLACNQEMSVTVLGVTETATSSSSSGYAQSETHQKQQGEVIEDDMAYLLNYLNDEKFVKILNHLDIPVSEGGRFEFEKEVDLNELKVKKDIDIAISGKVPMSDDYFYETYNIPKPDNYDELKAQMEEERQMKLNPPDPGNPKPQTPNKKPKPGKPANLSYWDKLRLTLADFFDPAP